MGRTAMTAEEKKLAAEKRAAAKKAAEEKAAAEQETMEANADDVIGVKEDGTTVPLTDLAPELKNETVEVEMEETFTKTQVEDMIAAAVAKAMEQTQTATPSVSQFGGETERVQFLFQAPVSDENVFEVGQGMYGRIVGKTGAFSVPKQELSRAMDGLFRRLMDKRWIIVVSGMTEEERKAYNVDYKDGEILDKGAFTHLVDLGMELVDIYPKLCKGHREIVTKAIYEAYSIGNKNVTRELAKALNDASRELGNKKGDFTALIEAMNRDDVE